MLSLDLMDFTMAGGGEIGYNNYYKYHYVKWLKSSERTWFQKLMFWDVFIDNPPENYKYPSLYEKN